MALDHYIPQVYLRHWTCEDREFRQVLVTRKSDLLEFPANSKSICRIDEGNTNNYFENTRIIEEFLKDIEPVYSKAVRVFRTPNITKNELHVVAGLMAYIICCSPTAIRLGIQTINGMLKAEIAALERMKLLPNPPKEFSGRSLVEIIENGEINLEIDTKYQHSIGIDTILGMMSYLVDAQWQILLAESGSDRFLTSDFPVPILIPVDREPVTRIFPLAPDMAVVVKGKDSRVDINARVIDFTNFKFQQIPAKKQLVRKINDLIVKSAENLIISNSRPIWLKDFVKKRRNIRLENVVTRTPSSRGLLVSSKLIYVSD